MPILFSRGALAAALVLSFSSCHPKVVVRASDAPGCTPDGVVVAPPYIAGRTLVDGVLSDGPGATLNEDPDATAPAATGRRRTAGMEVSNHANVYGCCTVADTSCSDSGNVASSSSGVGELKRPVIGTMPQFTREQALSVLDSARAAWDGGSGRWPQMSLRERVESIERFLEELSTKREDIVTVLMWEIGKNRKDAESEFDRTVQFVRQTIEVIRTHPDYSAQWDAVGNVRAFVRRAAIGIIVCLGPFNYPLNETYATLIPALLMGNVVIMKIPTVGGLAHLLTMEAFSKALPPGSINLISGSGRATMPPLMETGNVDGLAFIGGSAAADDLIKRHPEPHRLKLFLQLEAKNMAIFLPDLFERENAKEFNHALDEAVAGSLSYNGQRCTALKILFVPSSRAAEFSMRLAERVESLAVGLPWEILGGEDGKGSYSKITPLPNRKRVEYMQSLIADATSKGASIVNSNGGSIVGGEDSTLMVPAVLYPVTPDMLLYDEEQFGPVVPITEYGDKDLEVVLKYGREGKYGQQVSIFTASGGEESAAATIIDRFSSVFGKININSQCGRSPDSLPFSGRRSSAMGVMSVTEALKEFSVPTVVSYKHKQTDEMVVKAIQQDSSFMQSF